jgi:hypothetical protein
MWRDSLFSNIEVMAAGQGGSTGFPLAVNYCGCFYWPVY